MTQPAPNTSGFGGFFTRKLGPLPMWLWLLLVVGAVFLYMKFKGGSSSNSTAQDNNPGVTTTPNLYTPFPNDIFVNVQQPTAPGPQGPPGPSGPQGPMGPPSPVPAGTVIANTPSVPGRQQSITYPVVSGDSLTRIAKKFGISTTALYTANKAQIEAVAHQHGYKSSANGKWIFPQEQLVIPG